MDASKLGISNYAHSFLADLLFVEELIGAVHEGDGDRMMTIWKYLLFISDLPATEIIPMRMSTSLPQACSLLSERSAHCLKWCRFVNTTGKPCKHHSCDLEMEHWNAAFIAHVATAGGNVNASTITRTGMALSTLQQVCSSFDSATNIRPLTSRHYKKKDEDMVVDALHRKYNVFEAEGTHVKFQFHEITSTKLTESLLNGSKGISKSCLQCKISS